MSKTRISLQHFEELASNNDASLTRRGTHRGTRKRSVPRIHTSVVDSENKRASLGDLTASKISGVGIPWDARTHARTCKQQPRCRSTRAATGVEHPKISPAGAGDTTACTRPGARTHTRGEREKMLTLSSVIS